MLQMSSDCQPYEFNTIAELSVAPPACVVLFTPPAPPQLNVVMVVAIARIFNEIHTRSGYLLTML